MVSLPQDPRRAHPVTSYHLNKKYLNSEAKVKFRHRVTDGCSEPQILSISNSTSQLRLILLPQGVRLVRPMIRYDKNCRAQNINIRSHFITKDCCRREFAFSVIN